MKKFNEAVEKNIEKLRLYVPIVERVHGKEHPEFHDVRKLFDSLNGKIEENSNDSLDLNPEFKELRQVTDNYKVPSDTCESYEAVYEMLSELDEAYSK